MPTGVDTWGVDVTHDFDAVLGAADVVMMPCGARERMSSVLLTAREYLDGFGLTVERLGRVKPSAAIMHPGPINRGVEMSSQWPRTPPPRASSTRPPPAWRSG